MAVKPLAYGRAVDHLLGFEAVAEEPQESETAVETAVERVVDEDQEVEALVVVKDASTTAELPVC
jgi:hypothetical protein